MTYVMSKLAYKHYSKGIPMMSDAEILIYVNRMMSLKGTFTKLQVQ